MATVEEDLVAEAGYVLEGFNRLVASLEEKAAREKLSAEEEHELAEARLDQKAAASRLSRIKDAIAGGNVARAKHIARSRCSG